MKNTQVILVVFLFLFSCNQKQAENSTIQLKPNGFWQQVGYGYGNVIELKGSTIKVFNISEQHCQFSHEEAVLDFGETKSFSKKYIDYSARNR